MSGEVKGHTRGAKNARFEKSGNDVTDFALFSSSGVSLTNGAGLLEIALKVRQGGSSGVVYKVKTTALWDRLMEGDETWAVNGLSKSEAAVYYS